LYQALLADVTFHHALLKLDEEIAANRKREGCASCEGPIDVANYCRKPRAALRSSWSEGDAVRFSFCCRKDGCRKRSTPASVRFLGRRIYLGAVVLIASALLGGVTSITKLSKELGPDRRTLVRWRHWWTKTFPRSAVFAAARGRLAVAIDEDQLPLSLLDRLRGSASDRTLAMLELLEPLSIG
jgi:hypothetical protein